MIEPNAKCVVNGSKLNELISWINESMEQLDVVDQNNYASKRWFLISDASNVNQGASPDASRDKMPREGGGQDNRDSLNTLEPDGRGVNTSMGIAGDLSDDGLTAEGARKQFLANKNKGASSGIDFSNIDEFGNVIGLGGNGRAGDLIDDGLTAEGARKQFLANKKKGASPSDIDFSKTDEFGNVIGLGGNGMRPQQPSGALRDDGGQPTAPPRVGATPPNATEKESADIRGKERSNKQTNFKGKASDFEKQRRGLQEFRKKSQRNSTETFLQDLATKKRQMQADREAAANRMGGKYSPYARGRG